MNANIRSAKDLLPLTLFLPMLLGANLGIPKVVRSDNRSAFIPRLRVGQSMRYETGARLERHVKSESRVVTLLGPREVRRDLSTGFMVTIKGLEGAGDRPTVAAVAELDPPDDTAGAPPPRQTVNFTIEENGQLGRAEGLDALAPEQRLAWQFWIARFAYGWTLPLTGIKPGEKWKSEEPEETPS